MTQENKELLLKDLSGRLSYGVIVNARYKDGEGWKIEDRKLFGIYKDEQVYLDGIYTTIDNIKPYLRPMSSMTEEEYRDLKSISSYYGFAPYEYIGDWCPNYEMADWLNLHRFDYRGLIKKGLAIEVTDIPYNP